jgi:hypothetical protein
VRILLGDFSVKEVREDIIEPTIRNKRLHEISNNNGVRVVNFATSKNLIVRQCSHIATSINVPGHLQMGKPMTRLMIF